MTYKKGTKALLILVLCQCLEQKKKKNQYTGNSLASTQNCNGQWTRSCSQSYSKLKNQTVTIL